MISQIAWPRADVMAARPPKELLPVVILRGILQTVVEGVHGDLLRSDPRIVC